MATTLSYSVADFQPFTKIISADMNTKLNDIKSRLNWSGGTDATTGLGDDNIQSAAVSGGGLTRATKLKAGTASHVVINDGTGAMSSEATLALARGGLAFAPSLSGNAGKAVVVNDAESALSLGAPSTSQLTQSFSSDITDLTAGETIALNDAVCLALSKNSSNADTYKVFQCDDDLVDRRVNFIGFATAAAAVTAHTLTWTNSAALVTSNVISYSINGRAYSTTFATDNDTTLAAVATQIATDPEVQSASVVDAGSNDRVINVTGKGGLYLNITGAVVTLGASQATVTIATVAAPTGANVRIRCFGPMTGMSGLTVGARYYLSGTTAAITTTPTAPDAVFVGQALSTSVLFVNISQGYFQFSSPTTFVRSHGGSNAETVANGTQDVEHFNFTTWSAGTAGTAGARMFLQGGGNSTYGAFHHQLDGIATGGAVTLLHTRYNKATWATLTNRSSAKRGYGLASFNGFLYSGKGSTAAGGGSELTSVDKWNGASWTNGAATVSSGSESVGGFVQGSLFHIIAGLAGGVGQNYHDTINTSDVYASATVYPASARSGGGGSIGTSGFNITINTTNSYIWSGSWSSAITVSYTTGTSQAGAASGYSAGVNRTVLNGGNSGASLNTTATSNGSTWAAGTSSTNSRAAPAGSVI